MNSAQNAARFHPKHRISLANTSDWEDWQIDIEESVRFITRFCLPWRNAQVSFFQLGFDALDSIQASVPEMFITGVKIDDMDGLEHLEPFIETTLPILVLTSRHDPRTLELLRNVRFDGLYDGNAEGLENLPVAMQEVLKRRLYVSPTMLPHLKRPRNIILDTLTEKEQLVLALIGAGTDDQQAATQLGLSPHTV